MSKTRRAKGVVTDTADKEHGDAFEDLTTGELRKLLKHRGLNPKGDKEVLIQRLREDSMEDAVSAKSTRERTPTRNKEHADVSEYDRKLRREKILRMDMQSITEEIVQLTQESNRQVRVDNLLKELNELKEKYHDISNEIIAAK